MNLDQLRATIEKNKKGLAIAGAAGVAGLALLNKKKGGAPAAAGEGGPTSGSQYGLAPMPATGAGGVYDSSSSDVYNAIQPQLEALGRLFEQAKSPIPVPAPPPIASTLFAPKGTGNYLLYGGGNVVEVQEDGSQLGLTWDQWRPLSERFRPTRAPMQQHAPGAAYYETAGNINNTKK